MKRVTVGFLLLSVLALAGAAACSHDEKVSYCQAVGLSRNDCEDLVGGDDPPPSNEPPNYGGAPGTGCNPTSGGCDDHQHVP